MLTESQFERVRKSAKPPPPVIGRGRVLRGNQSSQSVYRPGFKIKRVWSSPQSQVSSPENKCNQKSTVSCDFERPDLPPRPITQKPLHIYGDSKLLRVNSDDVDATVTEVKTKRLRARNVPEHISDADLKIFFENKVKCGGGEVCEIKRCSTKKEVIVEYKGQKGKKQFWFNQIH